MDVVLKQLDRKASLKAVRLVLAFAKDTKSIRNPGRLKAFLADLLPKHPVECDLLKKAISFNAIVTINHAATQSEIRGAVHSLIHGMLTEHVSPEGAVFAASVLAVAIKTDDEELSKSWEQYLSSAPWLGTKSSPKILKIESPAIKETIRLSDVDTEINNVAAIFQYDTLGEVTVINNQPNHIA